MADWAFDSGSPAIQASSAAAAGGSDEVADRTSVITGKLKTIYRKTVLPVEKRFKYDYFFESPFLSDVEFDGTYLDVIGCILSMFVSYLWVCLQMVFVFSRKRNERPILTSLVPLY